MEEKELEKILKSLANRRRLAIVKYIKIKKTVSVGDIAAHIKISFKATSKHLALLTAADILEKDQLSTFMIFKLSPTMSEAATRVVLLL